MNKSNRSLMVFGSLASLFLAGCGGSGSDSSPGGGGTSADFGSVSVRSRTALAQPIVANSGQTAATAVFGSAITEIRLKLPPINAMNVEEVLSQTYLAFDFGARPRLFDNGTGQVLTLVPEPPILSYNSQPTASTTRIAYTEQSGQSEIINIFTCDYDGGNRVQVTNAGTHSLQPSFNFNGTKIAFTRNNRIYTMSPNGANLTPLTPNTETCSFPRYSPDGSKIAYVKTDTASRIMIMNADGTGKQEKTAFTGYPRGLAWSGTGRDLYYAMPSGTDSHIFRISPNSVDYFFTVPAPIVGLAVSPVGNRFAYSLPTPGGLVVRDLDSAQESVMIHGETSYPFWTPYMDSRLMLGPASPFGTTASGFIFTQQGSKVPAMVAFNATTPSSVVVAKGDTPGGSSTIVFTIEADSLTSIQYINNLHNGSVKVLTGGATASGAVVGIDASNGKVASVVPYRGTASNALRQSRNGTQLRFKGEFLGAWNVEGKNLAPSGASEIVIDTVSGKLLVNR